MIKAKCPSCGWKDDVDDSFLGAEAECPECETVFTVKKLRKKKKKVKKTNELIVAPKEDFEKISVNEDDAREKLGEFQKTYKSCIANQFAGYVFSMVGLLLGGYMIRNAFSFLKEGEVGSMIALGLMSLVPIGFAINGIVVLRKRGKGRVKFHENGFISQSAEASSIFLWEHIVSIKEEVSYESYPFLSGPAKRIKQKHSDYIVIRRDGLQFIFSENTLSKYNVFANELQLKILPYNVPWHVVEYE
ncbi:MAG: hypothetical protein HRT89_17145 [Lentisphaeria bacterium]|nr:hypothetical protein [Lentisphaeria bacterium]